MMDYNEIMKENPILESSRLILRPFSINDINDVFLYAGDDIVTKYLTWPSHTDIPQTEKSVKDHFLNKIGTFAIELKSERRCIGCIDLRVCSDDNKASFGYVLNRKYWNNNYMSESLNLILELSFSRLGLNRVEGTHYVGNEGSGRVMQKCGMKYEGLGLQEVKVKGIFYDVVHFAILRVDWINAIKFKTS